MIGKVVTLLVFASVGSILAFWYYLTRNLPAKTQLSISVCMVVLTWAWEANTAMVLQRVGRYCFDEPMWPPFSGHTVLVPQPIMLVMSLLFFGSLGMALRAFVKFVERQEEPSR